MVFWECFMVVVCALYMGTYLSNKISSYQIVFKVVGCDSNKIFWASFIK